MNNVNSLKSVLVVVGGSIAAAPASALELGEVTVHSSLGQPLRASVSYALGQNEAISGTCVSLLPASGSLPAVDKAAMVVVDGIITITGNAAVREPMMSLRVSVNCKYSPLLTRDYLLFINPAESQGAPIAAPTAARVASQPQLAQPPVVRQPAQTPIEIASRYQVQPGDSLSQIVQRIENRPVGLSAAANAIFAANPDAFLDNDANKLSAGSWLTIPSFGDVPASIAAESEAPVLSDPVEPAATSDVYEPVSMPAPSPAPVEPVATTAAPDAEQLAELQPGDIILSRDSQFVESVGIPETQLEGPATTSSSPNVPVAIIRQPAAEEARGGNNWLLWLGGAGLAFLLGLALFGRRLYDRFGSTPAPEVVPQRSDTEVDPMPEPDMQIDDDSPTAENLALDADLFIGTGLQEGTEVDVATDFAFAQTTELDIELTEDMADDEEREPTDIIPPINIEESSILKSEVMPDDDDDDEYDMSVIVDATKMPDPADVTERDLEAVAVDDGDESLITGNYSISQEVDYKILEQDYEDEMTATQALNEEIQKAAEELAVGIYDDVTAEYPTQQKSQATVHPLDKTASMPQGESAEPIGDDDDTGVNPTINLEAMNDTVEFKKKDSKAS